jgi:hypothetical protein
MPTLRSLVDNAWIGRAFQDHLDLRVADVEPIDRKRFADTFDNIFIEGFKYTPKVVLSQPAQEKAKVSNVGGVLVRIFAYRASRKREDFSTCVA